MKERRAFIVIPITTLSLNITRKKHWAALRKWKAQAGMLVKNALQKVGRDNLPPFGVKVGMRITRYGHNLMDHDNFVGGTKDLMDLFQDFKVIEDDGPEYITCQYEQSKDRRNTRTEIEFWWEEPEKVTPPPPVENKGASVTRLAITVGGTMQLTAHPVRIHTAKLVKSYDTEQNETRTALRMVLDVTFTDDEVKSIPFISETVLAAIDSSRKVKEGKDSTRIGVKRDFPLMRYTLHRGGAEYSIVGKVVLEPTVTVVAGVAGYRFTIDGDVHCDDMAILGAMIQREDTTLTTRKLQGELPFEAEEAA